MDSQDLLRNKSELVQISIRKEERKGNNAEYWDILLAVKRENVSKKCFIWIFINTRPKEEGT